MWTTTNHLFIDALGVRVISLRVRKKWLLPEIPFCTQTSLLLWKSIDSTTFVLHGFFCRINWFWTWVSKIRVKIFRPSFEVFLSRTLRNVTRWLQIAIIQTGRDPWRFLLARNRTKKQGYERVEGLSLFHSKYMGAIFPHKFSRNLADFELFGKNKHCLYLRKEKVI